METVIGPTAPKAVKPFNLIAHWRAGEGAQSIEDLGGFQTRNRATQKLLADAFQVARGELKKSFSAGVQTDDFPKPVDPEAIYFAYCRSAEQRNVIAIPDFLFWGWPEAGIEDYETTVERMLQQSGHPPTDNRLLWIGNAATHPTRLRFLEIAKDDPRIHVCGMDWRPPENPAEIGAAWKPSGGFISMPDHCRYRMLIDLQGRGFSARLSLLLFSGRPVFIQARRWRQYYFDLLQPFVHYIPVNEDLSDLSRQIDWAAAHPEKAAAIAARAQEFARTHLRRRHAVRYLADRLIEFSNR
jgi:glycosyl transferase family 90